MLRTKQELDEAAAQLAHLSKSVQEAVVVAERQAQGGGTDELNALEVLRARLDRTKKELASIYGELEQLERARDERSIQRSPMATGPG